MQREIMILIEMTSRHLETGWATKLAKSIKNIKNTKKQFSKFVKNMGFDRNGHHHEAGLEK